jgi:MoaA/NifB/PqqE/SkfB family radical SAM enzyme
MLLLELTKTCNNACRFCSQADERAAGSSCEIDAPLSAVAGAAVAIVGGEPTLDGRLLEVAARARDGGAASVWVQTNARRLAYKSYAEELARNGVQALEVSLQGSSAAMHEYHTRAEGSFAQTVRGIANAVQARLRVAVTAVVTRSNLRHLETIVRTAHTVGAGAVRLRRVRAVGGALQEQARLVPAPALAAAHLYEARAVGDQLGIPVFFEVVDDPQQPFIDFVGGPQETRLASSGRSPEASVGRAHPAVGESRARDRLSGDALRDIFPALFEAVPEKR